MKLKTGVDPTSRISFKNTRGLPFHGMGAFVGIGKTQRAHVYTAASIPVDPEAYKKIDPKKLAVELGVDMCAVNSGRFWMMDEIEFVVGDVQNFHGVELRWGGDMTGAEMLTQFQSAYVPSLIRRNTVWTFKAGKPVLPAARAWRPSVGLAGIHESGRSEPDPRQPRHGGRQAEEPAGRLEVRNQGADRGPVAGHGSRRGLGSYHSRRIGLHLPGLRLRCGHQRQLRAVTRSGGCRTDRESRPDVRAKPSGHD